MALMDSLLKFISTKWFILCLGLALIGALPFTFHNFQVVWESGQLSRFWWVITVFIFNILSVIMCVYKFMSMVGKKEVAQSEW